MIRSLSVAVVSFVIGAFGTLLFFRFVPVLFSADDATSFTGFRAGRPQVVGFLPYWLLSKADKPYEKYISTLTYFGLAMNADGTIMKRTNPQETEPGWLALGSDAVSGKLAHAKKSGLKRSLLIISGDDAVIASALSDPQASARNLMGDVAPIMREQGFTDLNLDIESFMEASDSGRAAFTAFVRAVKNELVSQRLGSLTLDIIPIALMKPKLYDFKALAAIADAIVLMTYDFHYMGSYTSGSVAPVGGAGVTLEFDVETSVREALKLAPKEKILLGIPLYGYQWETIHSASESATIAGGSETISSRRVMELLQDCPHCTTGIDDLGKEPYVIYPEGEVFKQAYYEDESAMKEKLALAQKYNLGGVALWALGYEDDTLLRPLAAYKNTLSLSW